MRKIFYFSSSISFEKTEAILKSSPVIYWLCNIRLMEPPFFRLPYWKYTDRGQEIIIPPFVVAGFVEAVFIWKHNAVFEYMRYLKDGWFGS